MSSFKSFIHQEIPSNCIVLFKAFYYLFQKRYEEEAKTLDHLEKNVRELKMELDPNIFEKLLKDIALTRLRISYFSNKVLTQNEFLAVNQDDVWQQLKTPFHYYQAILYLQQEFVKIHNAVSPHLKKTNPSR